MYSMIVAHGRNREIGKDNKLLWRLPNDMKHFRKVTENKVVVMGRKTYESIGKPLKNRVNVVITRDTTYKNDEVKIIHSLEEIKTLYSMYQKDVVIIGGGKVYEQCLDLVEKVYVTEIKEDFEADTYFPLLNGFTKVKEEQGERNDLNDYEYYFQEYVKEG